MEKKLNINEIFYALEGETTRAGFPAVFIRLTGCNLHCHYCDTVYARDTGSILTIEQVLEYVSKVAFCDHITITGGEPLLQMGTIVLSQALLKKGHSVQIETNGGIGLAEVPRDIRKIVDIKTPSSGEGESFIWENIKYLGEHDEVKFVISDTSDYTFSKEVVKYRMQNVPAAISFSPVFGKMGPETLARMIIADQLSVRLNIQLHKVLWPGQEECKKVLFQSI